MQLALRCSRGRPPRLQCWCRYYYPALAIHRQSSCRPGRAVAAGHRAQPELGTKADDARGVVPHFARAAVESRGRLGHPDDQRDPRRRFEVGHLGKHPLFAQILAMVACMRTKGDYDHKHTQMTVCGPQYVR